ncbi:MAG: cell division protein FtsL [Gammaproteobacteria bacterium]|jgi:cell division protein FtsL
MLKVAVVGALVVSVLMSAVSVVYVKHENRKQFVGLQQLERERDELQTRWNRLQLEYSAWATHDRIQEVANARLELHAPPTAAVVLVTR